VGADTGRESPAPPFAIVDEAIAVVRLDAGGAETGRLELPAFPTPDETFRPLTVDDEGAVYQMVPSADGLSVLRYAF
jgi:hypothetical protein